jgi:hypothetical protein
MSDARKFPARFRIPSQAIELLAIEGNQHSQPHQGNDVVKQMCLAHGHPHHSTLVRVHNVYVKMIYPSAFLQAGGQRTRRNTQ